MFDRFEYLIFVPPVNLVSREQVFATLGRDMWKLITHTNNLVCFERIRGRQFELLPSGVTQEDFDAMTKPQKRAAIKTGLGV